MQPDASAEAKIVLGQVGSLAKVLASAGLLAAAVCLARLFGLGKVGALGVDTPLEYVWVLLLGATIYHWVTAIDIHHALDLYITDEYERLPREERYPVTGQALFDEIRSYDSRLLRGIMARQPKAPDSRIRVMSWSDPTTLPFLALAGVTYLAVLPWSTSGGSLHWTAGPGVVIGLFVMTILLLWLNWAAGSAWTTAISDLKLPLVAEGNSLSLFRGISAPQGNEWGCILLIFGPVVLLPGLIVLVVHLF